MTQPTEDVTAEVEAGESNWRDRALERSLRSAKAKAMSRSDRFIATAMEILQETGRTDFTVQELVDRSHTSLRSFYQYFSGKDELLLALLEESIAKSVARWREQTADKDALTALETVVESIYGNGTDDGLNRGLAPYHVNLAESHRADYYRAIEPMVRLIQELLERGMAEGKLRSDVVPERLLRVFIQSVIGAALFTSLGRSDDKESSDAQAMWEFCRLGLVGTDG